MLVAMERSTTSPDEFIASLPDSVRADIATLDGVLSAAMAGQERVLWEGPMWGGTHQRIIGYGAMHYVNRSGTAVDWFVVGLAAQKQHLSLYVSAVVDGAYVLHEYADRLGKVKVGSANVTFRRAADIHLDVLRAMATRAREATTA
jgi:hypothetical protein